MHRRTAVENNQAQFVDNVSEPELPVQANSWGCADAEIEEIRLGDASSLGYVSGLRASIKAPMTQVSEIAYIRDTYDKVDYDADHILPYLVDVLASAPKHWNVAWFGFNKQMFEAFRTAWPKLGFTGHILTEKHTVPSGAEGAFVVCAGFNEVLSKADVFIFDFAAPDGGPLGDAEMSNRQSLHNLQRRFFSVIKVEQDLSSTGNRFPRRVIAINAIHNRFESLVRGCIEFARSPFSGRLRHGYVLPALKEVTPWLALMTPRSAGRRKGEQIRTHQMRRGQVISGPHMSLLPGQYTVTLDIKPKFPKFPVGWLKFLLVTIFGGRISKVTRILLMGSSARVQPQKERLSGGSASRWRKSGAVAVEIRNGEYVVSRHRLSLADLWFRRRHSFSLSIVDDDLEYQALPSVNVRVWTSGQVALQVDGLDLVSGGPE
jgi:hypothetical protein